MRDISKGDILIADLGEKVPGLVVHGKRPSVVVSEMLYGAMVTIIPLTTSEGLYIQEMPLCLELNNDKYHINRERNYVLIRHIRGVEREKLHGLITRLDKSDLKRLDEMVSKSLGLKQAPIQEPQFKIIRSEKMDNLVFLKSNELHEEPFTTSEIIAEKAEVTHHAVQQLINKYQVELSEFGEVSFEMRAEVNQGFSGSLNHSSKIYRLNEQQATLLITFLQNTPVVVQFKKALVQEFYRMKYELTQRRITRQIGKIERKSLTETIKDKYPDKKWIFKHYTDLDYKCVLGMTAKQFEALYNIPDGKLRNYLEAGQLEKIGIIEAATKALIDAGYTYEEIKDILGRKFLEHKVG